MQNKNIKNILSGVFIILFISFLLIVNFMEKNKKVVKTVSYTNIEDFNENKYGLFLSSLHANFNGDYDKLSSFYDEAVKQNNNDFLGRLFILQSTNENRDEVLKLALSEYKKNNQNIVPVMYLANDYFVKKQYSKSLQLLNDLKGKSDTFIVKLLKAWNLTAQKKYDDALDLLETELDNKAFRKYILMHLGAIAEIADDKSYATEIYEEVLKTERVNIFDIENISSFYLRSKNQKQAVKVISDYYAKMPDSVSVLMLLNGVRDGSYTPVFIDTANKGMAKAIFDISSIFSSVFASSQDLHLMYLTMIDDLYPDFYMSTLVKSEVYKNLNKPALFFKYSNKVPEDNYLYTTSKLNEALYYLQSDTTKDKGLGIFNNLISKYPNIPQLYFRLGSYYQNNKDYVQAIDNYSKALSFADSDKLRGDIYFARAQIYDIDKNTENAKNDLEEAFKLKDVNPVFLNYYGYFLINNNLDLDKGLDLISRAVANEPTNPFFLDSFGWALFKKGDFEKSLKLLELAKSIEPKNPVIIDHLADVYWSLNRKREAVFEWQKALSFKDYNKNSIEPININKIEYKINYGL